MPDYSPQGRRYTAKLDDSSQQSFELALSYWHVWPKRSGGARYKILGANGKKLAAKNRRTADEFGSQLLAKLDAGLLQRSYSEIARKLNAAGITTVTGRRFYPQTVKNYLRRPQPVAGTQGLSGVH
jgi:hypothetical protein